MSKQAPQPQQTPPHSEEAERACLAAVLLSPSLFDDMSAALGADPAAAFYIRRNALIWEGFAELAKAGTPIDLRTLQAALEDRGSFKDAGGLAYLAGLDLDLPDISRAVDHYAAIVRERAARRRLIRLSQDMGRHALEGDGPAAAELATTYRRALEEVEEGGPAGGDTRAAALVSGVLEDARARRERQQETGKPVIGLPTGLPDLDLLLSGLNQGLYALAGGPGTGKTTLALQMALAVAESGAPAVYVTFENAAAGLALKALCSRIAYDEDAHPPQMTISPRDVFRGYADMARLEDAAQSLEDAFSRLHLVDGDGALTVARLRGICRRAGEAAAGAPVFVVLDYLQLWAKASRELRGISDVRARVDILASDMIALSRYNGGPVLCLSSQSRASGYGRGEGSASLDTFKESGDIEYAADCALFLTKPKEDDEDGPLPSTPTASPRLLTVSKQRVGPVGEVSLIFNPQRGLFREESSAEPPPF